MELAHAIEQRRTVRRFTSDPVPEGSLKELVRRAGLAPSINNSQPWRFIAVTNRTLIQKMAAAVHQSIATVFAGTPRENALKTVDHFSTIFEHAPAVIFIAAQPYKAMADDLQSSAVSHEEINELRRHPDIQSIGAATQNILLSAVELGLGACWLSGMMVARPELEKLLNLAQPWELVTAVAVGKPDAMPQPKSHPPIEEIFELIR